MDPLYVRTMDRLYLVAIWTAGAAIFVMSLIIPFGVFTRYVLGTGSSWPEPVAILLMLVFTFIGAAASYRAGAHIAVQLLTGAMPPMVQRSLAFVVDLLMLAVCAFVVKYGLSLCEETWGQSIAELPWMPVGVSYLPLPIGSAIMGLFVIERMVYGDQSKRDIVRFEELADPATEGAH